MSQIDEVRRIADECKSIVNTYSDAVHFSENYLQEIDTNIDILLKSDKPKLMVCGVYSAGKSTLINDLCGKYVAPVAASPETSRITEYDSGTDFVLIDSPGVDAPRQHEQITDEAIKKCHAIMFVISSKNAESEANYRKLQEWTKYDKPAIMVLNDKSDMLITGKTAELEKMTAKITQNMQRMGFKDASYDIILVNAKVAEKAIFSNNGDEHKKSELLRRSNLPELAANIERRMKSGKSVYLAPIGELQRVLDGMETDLTRTAVGIEDDSLIDALNKIKREKNRMNDSINLSIKKAIDDVRGEVIQFCLTATTDDQINQFLGDVMQNITNQVSNSIERQLSRLAEVVNTNLDSLDIHMSNNGSIQIQDSQVSFASLMTNMPQNVDEELHPDEFFDNMKSGAVMGNEIAQMISNVAAGKDISSIAGTVAGSLTGLATGAGTLAGLAAGAGTGALTGVAVSAGTGLASGLTGAGIGSLAGMGAGAALGSFVPVIGTVVGAALGGLFSIISSKKNREAQEAQIRAQIEEQNRQLAEAAAARYKNVQSQVNAYMHNVENNLTTAAGAMFSNAISTLQDIAYAKISQGKERDEKIAAAKNEVKRMKIELDGLKAALV